jgi:hypothetical protein
VGNADCKGLFILDCVEWLFEKGVRLCWDLVADNNNTFTWSGPSGVLGCTGQRRVAPLYGGVQSSTLNWRRLPRCAIERR